MFWDPIVGLGERVANNLHNQLSPRSLGIDEKIDYSGQERGIMDLFNSFIKPFSLYGALVFCALIMLAIWGIQKQIKKIK